MTKKPETSAEAEVKILPPDFSLKKKIGMDVDLKKIFTPERVNAAQKAIDDTQSDFMKWAVKDLVELEHSYRNLAQALDKPHGTTVAKLQKLAFSLKCQAGTFGFDLGSEVARSMHNYMEKHKKYDSERITVLRKHIDALQVIFQQNVQGMGGQMGTELLTSLKKLVAKYP